MPKSIDFRPVILAGGSGTRFWPRSRRARAKQVLALDGERSMIQQTVERLQKTTGKHTLSIVTTLPSVVVYADSGRIEQVLSNLIGNAIKYSQNGGPIEITLWEAMDAQEARLSVRDHGIGIPEKDRARIFEHFARASNADTYKISGTGFGLYLCRELVARHNGRIWFDDSLSARVGYYNPATGTYKTLTLSNKNAHPYNGLGVDSGNNTWFTEEFGGPTGSLGEVPAGTS